MGTDYLESLRFLKLSFVLLILAIELYLLICEDKWGIHFYDLMKEKFVQ